MNNVIPQWIYNNEEYDDENTLRKVFFEATGKALPKAPAENKAEFWSKYQIEYSEMPFYYTDGELLQQAKQQRAMKLAQLFVHFNGHDFDADETSIRRMTETIVAATVNGDDVNNTTVQWTLMDDTAIDITIADLAKVLKIATEKRTQMWREPYQE